MILRRSSVGWPITLGVVMIVLVVALIVLLVLSVVAANRTNSAGWWAILAVGTTFLVLVLVGVVLYLLLSIKEIRLNQRQSNFIDSVTHELKSPIASLKLYLQTLNRHSVPVERQSDFVRFMLEDVERLDSLINHLLDAARLDQRPADSEVSDVELAEVLRSCATTTCHRYQLPVSAISLDLEEALVRGRAVDVEIVFRNLIDNAAKYSGDSPQIWISSAASNGEVVTRIVDNGPGIPPSLRRKIFGRFVRLGSELERSQTGTGLGLFIVRTLVRRMKGRISVRGRTAQSGTEFEVALPGGAVAGAGRAEESPSALAHLPGGET